jgi:hypothetical protein
MGNCSNNSSPNTLKGKWNKKQNLRNPTSYVVDKKGNVKPIYTQL